MVMQKLETILPWILLFLSLSNPDTYRTKSLIGLGQEVGNNKAHAWLHKSLESLVRFSPWVWKVGPGPSMCGGQPWTGLDPITCLESELLNLWILGRKPLHIVLSSTCMMLFIGTLNDHLITHMGLSITRKEFRNEVTRYPV